MGDFHFNLLQGQGIKVLNFKFHVRKVSSWKCICVLYFHFCLTDQNYALRQQITRTNLLLLHFNRHIQMFLVLKVPKIDHLAVSFRLVPVSPALWATYCTIALLCVITIPSISNTGTWPNNSLPSAMENTSTLYQKGHITWNWGSQFDFMAFTVSLVLILGGMAEGNIYTSVCPFTGGGVYRRHFPPLSSPKAEEGRGYHGQVRMGIISSGWDWIGYSSGQNRMRLPPAKTGWGTPSPPGRNSTGGLSCTDGHIAQMWQRYLTQNSYLPNKIIANNNINTTTCKSLTIKIVNQSFIWRKLLPCSFKLNLLR